MPRNNHRIGGLDAQLFYSSGVAGKVRRQSKKDINLANISQNRQASGRESVDGQSPEQRHLV